MDPKVIPVIFKILTIIDFRGFFMGQKYNSYKTEKNLRGKFLLKTKATF